MLLFRSTLSKRGIGVLNTVYSIGGLNMTKNTGPRRRTQHINRRTTQSIFRAADHATTIGGPLNTYVVINFPETGDETATRMFTDIRHKFRDWLTYHARKDHAPGLPPLYVFSFENPGAVPHVNWVIHVPPALRDEFKHKLLRWVDRVHPTRRPFDVSAQAITSGTSKSVVKYIMKGTDPGYIDHFFLRRVYAPQGEIIGKRAGLSAALGPASRKKAGLLPAFHRSPLEKAA